MARRLVASSFSKVCFNFCKSNVPAGVTVVTVGVTFGFIEPLLVDFLRVNVFPICGFSSFELYLSQSLSFGFGFGFEFGFTECFCDTFVNNGVSAILVFVLFGIITVKGLIGDFKITLLNAFGETETLYGLLFFVDVFFTDVCGPTNVGGGGGGGGVAC